jgi:hypothetical protein
VVEKEYPEAAVERAMKVQEVIMRAMAKRITWWEAAEILPVWPDLDYGFNRLGHGHF